MQYKICPGLFWSQLPMDDTIGSSIGIATIGIPGVAFAKSVKDHGLDGAPDGETSSISNIFVQHLPVTRRCLLSGRNAIPLRT